MTTEQRPPDGPVAPEAVNHLVLNVSDMERSHDFWTRIIGFRQVGEIDRKGLHMRFYQGAAGNHHDLALSQVMGEPAGGPGEPWRMAPAKQTGLNHVAIKWADREAWLRQVAWMQSQGVPFHYRMEHGMTHSVYVSDPDGHGIEVLYELPREVWEGDVNAALNYAKPLPTEGPGALEDDTGYRVFAREGAGN
jgi:catechol-2,3-dioxygenase